MVRRLNLAFAFVAFAFSVLLSAARPAQAYPASKWYPNPVNGPYYIYADGHVSQPSNGSKWAFGYFNICSTPQVGYAYFSASVAPNYATHSYALNSSFVIGLSTGGSIVVDAGAIWNWSPGRSGTIMFWDPNFGDDGITGHPQWIPVSAGNNSSTEYAQIHDNVIPDGISSAMTVYYFCCDAGTCG